MIFSPLKDSPDAGREIIKAIKIAKKMRMRMRMRKWKRH
jgi:hypothetical protein